MSSLQSQTTVRKTVRRAYNKGADQREIVKSCLDVASKLVASSSSLSPQHSKKEITIPPTVCFSEIANAEEYDKAFINSSGPLSGVTCAVSDAFDAIGFRTGYGVRSKMLHRAPAEESPFVHWVRKHGAQITGKIACHSPLAWSDCTNLANGHNAAYTCVTKGACHYSITTSVLGSAAVTAPLLHDIVGFKPTARSFDTGELSIQHPLVSSQHHPVGIVAATIDDIKYLWDVYSGAIQSSNIVQSIKEAEEREESRKAKEEAPNGMVPLDRLDDEALLERMVRSSQEPPMELAIGFPEEWISEYFSETFERPSDFEDTLQAMIDRAAQGTRKKLRAKLDIIPLHFDIDMEEVLRAQRMMAQYELSRAFDRNNSTVSSGILEELPEALVTAIFDGRNVTDAQYARAHRCRDYVVKAIESQFRDVDLICSPIYGAPHVDGNPRSVIATVPFAVAGNPVVSVQLKEGMAVQLVGEMGRDTGLLEDTTSFLRFVGKGRPPRWWRRKFLGEQN